MAISGAAVATLTTGGFLMYIGVRNVSVRDGLRDIVSGGPIKEGPKTQLIDALMLEAAPKTAGAGISGAATGVVSGTGTGSGSLGGGALGTRIVAAAQKYIGIPYVFGGASPAGFDCSGLVQYVLRHDLGIAVPDGVRRVRDFVRWSGVVTVSRPPAPGDLICWDFVHMGIAISATQMIHAPTPGQKVKTTNIWWSPAPIIKRVKG